MSNYTIITDIGCDLPSSLLQQLAIKCVDFSFRFEDSAQSYGSQDMTSEAFYHRMRQGGIARTSAANLDAFRTAFEPELQAGRDVLYLGFSSSLSHSVDIARMQAAELMEEYPHRQVVVVDTLCACGGLGLLVYLCAAERTSGASLTELARYAARIAPQVSHWFTVDSLMYLKRGGRVSAATALAGAVLNVKPVMHMDDDGRLTNVRKARGRKQALAALAEQYARTVQKNQPQYIISHGDCADDAQALEALIYAKTGHKATKMTEIGPVIGAHSGPGTLALFFLGTAR